MNNKVVTICYGEEKQWASRKEALNYFLEGIKSCEGSEKERYLSIYLELLAGKKICTDQNA